MADSDCNEALKGQLSERLRQVRSRRVREYVQGPFMEKIDMAGACAGAWLEDLEAHFQDMKPEGLLQGFTDQDFRELGFVLFGLE